MTVVHEAHVVGLGAEAEGAGVADPLHVIREGDLTAVLQTNGDTHPLARLRRVDLLDLRLRDDDLGPLVVAVVVAADDHCTGDPDARSKHEAAGNHAGEDRFLARIRLGHVSLRALGAATLTHVGHEIDLSWSFRLSRFA